LFVHSQVTSRKDQEQYWARKDEPYSFVVVQEFAEAFQSFREGRRIGDELAAPYDKRKSHPAALTTKKYGVGKKELFKASFSREYLLMKRNSFVYIFKLVQVDLNLIFLVPLILFKQDFDYCSFLCFQLAVMAVIAMTLFLRTEMPRETITDGTIYTGALFYTVIMIMFNGMAELSMTIVKLPVFYKQRDLLFYPSWVYALPTWVLKIPVAFFEVGVWVFMAYYVMGFDPSVGR
jgi:hypothetical protein